MHSFSPCQPRYLHLSYFVMLFLFAAFFGFLCPLFLCLPSLTTCHPLYIPPLFAVLSPFSTEFIHAFHCFLSISHPNAFIMPRSFAKTPLTISLTSGRGRLAEVQKEYQGAARHQRFHPSSDTVSPDQVQKI